MGLYGRIGKGGFPTTDEIIRRIRQFRYTSFRDMCVAEGFARSSLQEELQKDRGYTDWNRVVDELKLDKGAPSASTTVDTEFEPEWFHKTDVEALLKNEKQRSTRLANETVKLRGALYDQSETRRWMIQQMSNGIAEHRESHPLTVKYDPGHGADWVGHFPLADPHVGKYVWGKEGWGENYNTQIACERIAETGKQQAGWALRQQGRLTTAYVTNLGDFWHAIDGKTESGTLLHQDTRAKKVIHEGLDAELARLDAIRRVADFMVVDYTEGNHDHNWLHLFYVAIQQHFRNESDVKVNISFAKKVYFRVGDCIHFLDHGKGIATLSSPSSKRAAWAAIDRVVTREDKNRVLRYYFYCGHLHHRESSEEGSMELIRVPSLAEPDDYEEMLRVGSRPAAVAYRLDSKGNIEDEHRVYFGG